MKYVSTRGDAPVLEFEDVLLTGLARDGGLYVPEVWPQLSRQEIADLYGRPYHEVAYRVMAPFIGDAIPGEECQTLIEDAYSKFTQKAVAPLYQLDQNMWLLELFHGPTLAFKDFAMQVLARLMDRALIKRSERATIIGATSGDTGGAAIEAFRGREAIDIFILHPNGRVSDVQRRQMTTASEENVFNIAIEGNFDDCQAIVKQVFNDLSFRDHYCVTGVNSINWARIMAQIVYYFTAASSLGLANKDQTLEDQPRLTFVVPTGNFGDIFAGFVARQMGLPIDRLIIATNVNDILERTLSTGTYQPKQVIATESPSMDIQISSNFERLIFEMSGRDAHCVKSMMTDLSEEGRFTLPTSILELMREIFAAERVDQKGVKTVISDVYRQSGYQLDPHSAVGVGAAHKQQAKLQNQADEVSIVLSTAHPAKFPGVVEEATGQTVPSPEILRAQADRLERFVVLSNDAGKVKHYIAENTRARTDGTNVDHMVGMKAGGEKECAS